MNKLFSILILTGASLSVSAQNISSPYSIYGIGDLEQHFYDRSIGMANTSNSLLSTPFFQFMKNPASLTGLERSNLYLNLSLAAKGVTYVGNNVDRDNNNSKDFSIKSFSLATKINKFWASSIGFMPFTYVSYALAGTKDVEGSSTAFNATYEGDGGLYNVYWNNAVALNKNFSLGLKASYIFGSTNQTETLTSNELSYAITNKTREYYKNFRFEYGAIYRGKLNKDWAVSLGAKMAAKAKLTSQKTLTVSEGSTVIKDDEDAADGKFWLPNSFGAGLAFVNKDRLTFTVDADFAKWTGLNPGGSTYSYRDSRRFSAGFQLSNVVEQWGRRFEKNYIQAGVFTNYGHLSVRNQEINDFGASIGYGGFLSGSLFYGLGLEVGRRGTTVNNLIKENYVQGTITISLREFLYSKGRKYD